jgi:hypothetical protein
MKLQIRLVAIADHGPEQVHEIASLQRPSSSSRRWA